MTRKSRILISIVICLSLLVGGCAAVTTTQPTTVAPSNTSETSQTSTLNAVNLMASLSSAAWSVTPGVPSTEQLRSLNRFMAGLLQESLTNEGNVLISPLSVFLALTMTVNGAEGKTREAMLDTLASQGVTVDDLNRLSHDLIALLARSADKTTLSIANSIWFDRNFKADKTFLQTNADHFKAGAFKTDFMDPGAKDAINDWIEQETHGLIDEMIKRIDPQTVMMLINTLYFVSDWQTPFDKNLNRQMDFKAPTGDVSAEFMHRVGKMGAFEGAGIHGVVLPYVDPELAYFAFLNEEGVSPREWLATTDRNGLFDDLSDLVRQAPEKTVDLFLPKIKTGYEDSLVEELKALGMGIAFDAGLADFSLLSEEREQGLFIMDVKHKTFMRVDEKGTEAAAATVVVIGKTAIEKADLTMTFDRPYVHGVMDLKTGIPLFVGIMENPAP